jgi:arylsulfatase A-like enzyme
MCTAYEESARIPMILRYPRLLPGGRTWRSGVTLCDLAPTILEAAGVEAVVGGIVDAVAGSPFQGRSLIRQIREGNDTWTRPVVIENIPQAAISGSFYEERAIRTERYKLIVRKFDNRPEYRTGELYDLLDDPMEGRNVWGRQPDLLERLAEQLRDWGRGYHDPLGVELGEWTIRNLKG